MTDKTVSVPQQGICTHAQTKYELGNTYCAICGNWLSAGPPISVPTESRPHNLDASMDWAEHAAERIHLLYRDSNYFKSVPKEPLIQGWAEIIRTEFFKDPQLIRRCPKII